MVKIKSWGGAAIALAVLLLTLQNANAYEIVDTTPVHIAFNDDGTFEPVSTSADTNSLEAGATLSDLTYLLVKNDDGTYEYIIQTFSPALEWFKFVDPIKIFSSSSDCNTYCDRYAQTTCANYGNTNTDTYCDGSACYTSCEPSGSMCTSDSQCERSTECEYCEITAADCVSGKCTYPKCGDRGDCGLSLCVTNQDAIDMCMEQFDSSYKTVDSASCSSSGEPVCITMPRGDIDCTRNSDCLIPAENKCEYGVISYTCNDERNCEGDIAYSTCAWNCENKPAPTYYCGDGKCTGTETISSCPKDCKVITDPPNNCGNGFCESGETPESCSLDCGNGGNDDDECVVKDIGDEYCRGSDIVQDEQSASCSTITREIESCVIGCVDGACVQDDPRPNSYCGDNFCDIDEWKTNCPEDCGEPEENDYYCGDGICTSALGEKSTCPQDCGNNNGGNGETPDDYTWVILIVALLALVGAFVYLQRKQ